MTAKRPQPEKEVPVPDLTGRAEQLGAIIVKTLDLAEAGLSLGITVLTRAGAAAQGALAAPPAGVQRDGHEPAGPQDAPAQDGDAEPFFLANRVPLTPGAPVRVTFSITNDSLIEPKRVALRVGALVGELNGVRLDVFSVRPARKTIAPMDFEKFVLVGTLPEAAPPDAYAGVVVVASTDEMSIPVRLMVEAP
jgi:hypothetical protein